MAWVRSGDTAAMHPLVIGPLEFPEECDDRLVNELHGFVMRCAYNSGAYKTDYVVSTATAMSMAGAGRFTPLIAMALKVGVMSAVQLDDGRTAYKIVDTEPDFIHLRLRSEIEWEEQRKADNSNPALTVPVRLRDGDACRWCGVVVKWGDNKSGRGATYDHLDPGKPAEIDTYVVCCRTCNSSRKDGDAPTGITELLPPPVTPYFSVSTVAWFERSSYVRKHQIPIPKPSAVQVVPGQRVDGTQPPARDAVPTPAAPSAPSTAPDQHRPGTDTAVASSAERTHSDTDPSSATRTVGDDVADPADLSRSQSILANDQAPGLTGTGRDGSGRVGSRTPAGGAGSPPDPPVEVTRRRRGGRRRGGRRQPSGGSTRAGTPTNRDRPSSPNGATSEA